MTSESRISSGQQQQGLLTSLTATPKPVVRKGLEEPRQQNHRLMLLLLEVQISSNFTMDLVSFQTIERVKFSSSDQLNHYFTVVLFVSGLLLSLRDFNCVAHATIELMILLPQPPKHGDCDLHHHSCLTRLFLFEISVFLLQDVSKEKKKL